MSAAVEQISAAVQALDVEVNAALAKVKEHQRRANEIARDIDSKQSTLAALNAQVERAAAAANETLATLQNDVSTFEEQRAVAEGQLKSVLATLQRAEADLAKIRARVGA